MEHVSLPGNVGTGQPLSDLTHRVLDSIHEEIAAELPRLRDLSARLLQRHGDAYHAIAVPLIKLLEELRAAIEHRYIEEAGDLFPLVDALVRGEAPDDAARRLSAMRCRLELEQLLEAEMLDGVRSLTSAYRTPAQACPTIRDLYQGLERIDRSLRTQLMLENSVLFPRALALAAH